GRKADELDSDIEVGFLLGALGAPADFSDGLDHFPVFRDFDPQLVPGVHREALADADHGPALGQVDDGVFDGAEPQGGEDAGLADGGGRSFDLEAGVFPFVSGGGRDQALAGRLGRRSGSGCGTHLGHTLYPPRLLRSRAMNLSYDSPYSMNYVAFLDE